MLVIDDEESIRMLLEEGLSAFGLRVDCAGDAEAAAALLAARSYDVLLCDLNLTRAGGGKVSGRDVVDQVLAAVGPEKPSIIFMTGDSGRSRGVCGRLERVPYSAKTFQDFRCSDTGAGSLCREALRERKRKELVCDPTRLGGNQNTYEENLSRLHR